MKHQITLQDWLCKDKNLPKVITGEIVNETDKAVRVLYQNTFYWMPKSCVTLVKIKDPPETFGPALFLQKKLFPFQESGVQILMSMKSALLADEMGLGKTIQSIAYAVRSRRLPALIVCPASLSINWEREIRDAVTDPKIQRISNGKTDLLPDQDFYIIPYSLIIKYEEITLIGLRLVIMDECHYVKNYKAKRTQTLTKICDMVRNKLGLSGTPITNHQTEIFNIMRCIKPDVFGKDFFKFVNSYCVEDPASERFVIPGHMQKKVNERLASHMLRRLKSEVLADLPQKLTSVIPLDVPLKQYHDTLLKIAHEYHSKKGFVASDLTMLEKERQLCGKLKLEPGLEFVDDILEQGDPVVLFAVHRDIIDYLKMALKNHNPAVIVGDQNIEQRQQAVDDFQNGKTKVIIVSIQAGGVGITLTRASKCVFFEFDWSAANMRQATDRLHRIGQRNTVNVYYVIARKTLDEYIMQVLEGKAKSFHDMIDSERKELLVKFS